jgi:murein DD-endopeptidase MepM/ murein hydrolase activator NlpD
MPHMHQTPRLLATVAALGIGAAAVAPAIAAPRSQAIEGRFAIPRVIEWGDPAQARERTADGPFAPLVGAADLGTAENAFGAPRGGHLHAGQDIFAAPGTALVAVAAGVITDAGSDGAQGNYVHLYDPERDRTYVYMHLIAPSPLRTAERVRAGQRVGGLGCTGSCWGDHLHFEIRAGRGIGGDPSDPLPELRRWTRLERPL